MTKFKLMATSLLISHPLSPEVNPPASSALNTLLPFFRYLSHEAPYKLQHSQPSSSVSGTSVQGVEKGGVLGHGEGQEQGERLDAIIHQPPWMTFLPVGSLPSQLRAGAYGGLHGEILYFSQYVARIRGSMQKAVHRILSKITQTVAQLWPNAQVIHHSPSISK